MFSTVFLFLNIGSQEMIFIFVIALLFFGGKKLPELARGLGKGIREFKDASENIKRDINDQINDFEKDIDRQPSKKNTTTETETPESAATEVPKLDQAVDIPERPDDYAGEFENPGENPDDVSHSDSFYKHNYDYNEPGEYVDSSSGTAADKDDVRS